jgi:hypothetical protein
MGSGGSKIARPLSGGETMGLLRTGPSEFWGMISPEERP